MLSETELYQDVDYAMSMIYGNVFKIMCNNVYNESALIQNSKGSKKKYTEKKKVLERNEIPEISLVLNLVEIVCLGS